MGAVVVPVLDLLQVVTQLIDRCTGSSDGDGRRSIAGSRR
jgi:hypothetical protein